MHTAHLHSLILSCRTLLKDAVVERALVLALQGGPAKHFLIKSLLENIYCVLV